VVFEKTRHWFFRKTKVFIHPLLPIQALCLPQPGEQLLAVGTSATAMGWGVHTYFMKAWHSVYKDQLELMSPETVTETLDALATNQTARDLLVQTLQANLVKLFPGFEKISKDLKITQKNLTSAMAEIRNNFRKKVEEAGLPAEESKATMETLQAGLNSFQRILTSPESYKFVQDWPTPPSPDWTWVYVLIHESLKERGPFTAAPVSTMGKGGHSDFCTMVYRLCQLRRYNSSIFIER
jgi:hypothetical protein